MSFIKWHVIRGAIRGALCVGFIDYIWSTVGNLRGLRNRMNLFVFKALEVFGNLVVFIFALDQFCLRYTFVCPGYATACR
uniref:Uncharacterized protein n=1 Tax=Ixodes ricinus TaxID=34613 RepID=A0A6B0TVT0_IXORI